MKIDGKTWVLWVVLHLIIFSMILNSRSDLSLEGIVKSLQMKRGWIKSSQIDPDVYLAEAGLMLLLSASVYLIPIFFSAFKSAAQDKAEDTMAENNLHI